MLAFMCCAFDLEFHAIFDFREYICIRFIYLNIQGLVTMKSMLQKRTLVLSREDFILAMTKENPLFKEFSADGISKFQGIGRAMLICHRLCVICRYL